jgi:hypothetical protein
MLEEFPRRTATALARAWLELAREESVPLPFLARLHRLLARLLLADLSLRGDQEPGGPERRQPRGRAEGEEEEPGAAHQDGGEGQDARRRRRRRSRRGRHLQRPRPEGREAYFCLEGDEDDPEAGADLPAPAEEDLLRRAYEEFRDFFDSLLPGPGPLDVRA